MSISQPPPPRPSILSELERNARQMRAVWEALVTERDALLKERDTALQKARDRDNLYQAYSGTQDLLAAAQKERDQLKEQVAGFTAERSNFAVEAQKVRAELNDARAQIRRLYGFHDEIDDLLTHSGITPGPSRVDRIRFLVQERDVARKEIEHLEKREKRLEELVSTEQRRATATVNDAGVLLNQLVHAKALHERGDNEAYRKAKDGLWERAFALVGVPMPKHLDCPNCGTAHVDRDETADHPGGEDWTKHLHKTHLCHHCHTTWRPEERCHTVGVTRPPWQVAGPDALAQVFERLKLDASVVPRTGPLPQALVNQLDDINAVLEEAATRNLNILA